MRLHRLNNHSSQYKNAMARLSRDNINLILEFACDGLWVLYLNDNDRTMTRRANRAYAPIGRILAARVVMPCIFFTLQRRLCVMHKACGPPFDKNSDFWVFSSTESLNDELMTITIYAYQYTDHKYVYLFVDLYCMTASDFSRTPMSADIEPMHIGTAKRIDALVTDEELYSWQIELDI